MSRLFKSACLNLLALALVSSPLHAQDNITPETPPASETTSVTYTPTLGEILQQALTASDDLSIIESRLKQSKEAIGEVRANYYPQVTVSERFGRDAAYPSSARSLGNPLGASEYVNANTSKVEINQMVFDGFKTSSEIARQQKLLEALAQRHRAASNQVLNDTLEVYLTAWRHLQALRAGVAMVEDIRAVKAKVDMQAEAGATDQTVKSYVDSRLTGATQELLKTRNAYREALFRLGYLLQQQLTPESFGFTPLLAPKLQDIDTYIATARSQSPEILEELANKAASEHELRKARAASYPTLSLTSDMQDTNDVGGSTGTVRTGNAMVQVSYKLFDGFAASHGRARVKNQITESQFRLRRTSRRLEEDLSQAWRKAVASQQESKLATEEANASLKVKTLRTQDVETGNGDIVRLIEAEEALYTSVLRQLDLVQTVTLKRYELSIESGQLSNVSCVDGACPELPMETVSYTSLIDAAPNNPSPTELTAQTISTTMPPSTTEVTADTADLLPKTSTPPQEPIADQSLVAPVPAAPEASPQPEVPAIPQTQQAAEPQDTHDTTLPIEDPRREGSVVEPVPTPAEPTAPTLPDPDAPRDFEAPTK